MEAVVVRARACASPGSPAPTRAPCRPPGASHSAVVPRVPSAGDSGHVHITHEERVVNCTQQIGRLTADPQPLTTTEHGVVTSFRIAVPRPKGSAREADFFTVEAWRRL